MSGVQMRFVWTARQVATALRTVHLVSPARLPSFPFPEPQSAPPALRARALKMAGVRRRFVRTARLVGIALLTARLVSLVSKESGATPSQPQRAPIARQDSTTPTRRRLQFPIALTVVLAATAPRELQQRQLRLASPALPGSRAAPLLPRQSPPAGPAKRASTTKLRVPPTAWSAALERP